MQLQLECNLSKPGKLKKEWKIILLVPCRLKQEASYQKYSRIEHTKASSSKTNWTSSRYKGTAFPTCSLFLLKHSSNLLGNPMSAHVKGLSYVFFFWFNRNDSIIAWFAISLETEDEETEKLATYSTISKIFLVTPYEFHFVEIQFKCCYLQQKKQSLEFLTKFLYSNQMFSRNIFTTLCLKSERSAHAQLANTLLYILFKNILTWCHWGYLLKNGVTRRHHECGHATFPGTS